MLRLSRRLCSSFTRKKAGGGLYAAAPTVAGGGLAASPTTTAPRSRGRRPSAAAVRDEKPASRTAAAPSQRGRKRTSAAGRRGRRATAAERAAWGTVVLPWEARQSAVTYELHADAWRYLDRVLVAVAEMGDEEVSDRSLRLIGRDLLKDVEGSCVTLVKAAARRKSSSSSSSAGACQRKCRPATSDRAHNGANGSSSRSCREGVAAPGHAARAVKRAAVAVVSQAHGGNSSSNSASGKRRRKGTADTVHLV